MPRLNANRLPPSWRVEFLDSVAQRGSGHTPDKTKSEYWNGGVKWVSLSDSKALDKGYIFDTDKKISMKGIENSSAVIHPADTVVLSRDAGVGKSGVLAEPMAVSQHFIAWRCDDRTLHSWFLYYWLQWMKPEFERQAVGSTIKTIGLPYFKKLKLAVPSMHEQLKIVKILSLWDKAIQTVEKLIDNSQQQKKALMQQLLGGKLRISGFRDAWKERHLSDVAKVMVSPVDKKAIEGELPVLLCNYTDVYYNSFITSELEFMSATAKRGEIDRFTLERGDVLITKDSETPGDIAIPALVSENLDGIVCGYHLAIIRPNRKLVNGAFISYLFSTKRTRYYFFTLATGATRFGLSVEAIKKSHFRFPSIKEQRNIAKILYSADRCIDCLEQQRRSLIEEKKALMQQLLSGGLQPSKASIGPTDILDSESIRSQTDSENHARRQVYPN